LHRAGPAAVGSGESPESVVPVLAQPAKMHAIAKKQTKRLIVDPEYSMASDVFEPGSYSMSAPIS